MKKPIGVGYTSTKRFNERCDDLLIANIPFVTRTLVTAKGNVIHFIVRK